MTQLQFNLDMDIFKRFSNEFKYRNSCKISYCFSIK